MLEEVSEKKDMNREILLEVARTSLRTKLDADLAEKLTECIVDAVLAIKYVLKIELNSKLEKLKGKKAKRLTCTWWRSWRCSTSRPWTRN